MGSLIINIYVLRQKPTLSSDAKESKYAVNSQKDIFQEFENIDTTPFRTTVFFLHSFVHLIYFLSKTRV